MRSDNRRCPSGETYHFPTYTGEGGDPWVSIEDAEDARFLESKEVFEVDWSPIGKLKAKYGDAKEAIEEHLDYSEKQQLVGGDSLDLDVQGNAAEEELEEALERHVEELDNAGDI